MSRGLPPLAASAVAMSLDMSLDEACLTDVLLEFSTADCLQRSTLAVASAREDDGSNRAAYDERICAEHGTAL
jgi:hypothetical protein